MNSRKVVAQYNIRIDAELLNRYRKYCAENGLDAHGLIKNYMSRLVSADYHLQERLWETLLQDKN